MLTKDGPVTAVEVTGALDVGLPLVSPDRAPVVEPGELGAEELGAEVDDEDVASDVVASEQSAQELPHPDNTRLDPSSAPLTIAQNAPFERIVAVVALIVDIVMIGRR